MVLAQGSAPKKQILQVIDYVNHLRAYTESISTWGRFNQFGFVSALKLPELPPHQENGT